MLRGSSFRAMGWYPLAVHTLLSTAETVIFDLDGTLVHSAIDFSRLRAAAMKLASAAGFPIETLDGQDAMRVVYAVCGWLPERREQEFRDRAFAEFEAIEREYCLEVVAREGAKDLVDALRSMNIAVGVATRNSGALATKMLVGARIAVDCVVAREHVGRVKPDPEHYWSITSQLDRPRQGVCVIGDHPMDVRGGRNINASTIGVLPPGRDEFHFATCPPDLVVAELTELL